MLYQAWILAQPSSPECLLRLALMTQTQETAFVVVFVPEENKIAQTENRYVT